MPSLQTALPPELTNNVIRLYSKCLRIAKYIGHQLCGECGENDVYGHLIYPRAAMGLINHILYESEKMFGHKSSKST